MQARLRVLHDKANVKQVKLLPVTLIGRSTECNLKIASSQVSRAHCRITLGEDTVYVEDLGSANGTIVDGKRLIAHQPTSVVPGASLVVGPAEFLIDYVASTSATMILSRMSAPPVPSLSSTELLVPKANVERVAEPVSVPSSASAPAVINEIANSAQEKLAEAASVSTAIPTASPVVATPLAVAPVVAAPVVAAPVVARSVIAKPVAAGAVVAAPVVATAVAVAKELAAVPVVTAVVSSAEASPPVAASLGQVVSPAAPMASQPIAMAESAPVEMTFAGFGAPSDEPAQDTATQFMFGDFASNPDSPTSVNNPPTATAGNKKGGLKSLFSMFGRKAKGSEEQTTLPAIPSAPASAPNVFFPTMDQTESPAVPTEEETTTFSFGSQAASAPVVSIEAPIEPPSPPSPSPHADDATDEEDGFQQFLKQL